jgi:hypothetical protein
MFKIFMSVRNRLAITKKTLEAIFRHSSTPAEIYIFDNCTNYKLKEHFNYFRELYEEGKICQVTFNTEQSTFQAFSKAVASNQFLLNHLQDPKRDQYDFLLILDNDIMVTPNYDKVLSQAWKEITKLKMTNIKVIGQLPGGIKGKEELPQKISGFTAKIGKLGGSGLWSVKPTFANEVGLLNVQQLVGLDKRHDQLYWHLMEKSTNGKPYILGLGTKLGIHCGKYAGSTCNRLTIYRNSPNKLDMIKFEDAEIKIDAMSFEDFYQLILNDKELLNDW